MNEYKTEEVEKAIQDAINETTAPNIFICGQSGVGKSSLINFIFKEDVAQTCDKEPCTKEIDYYKSQSINIYDSEGYEIGSEKQDRYEKLIFTDFLDKKNGLDKEDVHLIWYAVSGAGKRFTDLDKKLINKMMAAKYPVAILLTKIDELDETQLDDMMKSINSELPKIPVFRITTIDNKDVQEYCDITKLEAWSHEQLKPIYKERFVSGLKAGLAEKRKSANVVIGLATAAAATAAASPIPFSDAAIITPIQAGMVVKIASIYGLTAQSSSIVSLVSSLGISNLGRTLAGNLLKIIPAIGSFAGGLINAGVASALTAAIGKGLESICYENCEKHLSGLEPIFDIESILKSSQFTELVSTIFSKERKEA